ncbi:DUF3240 family protein [Thalassotalea sediminis]|uniref:DUF3240 family protein n=1 Tax=Thalassotalea sediminis TaxID=1759089 RepID=UPI0025729764|nr:DUF3240 family protein [Thalassotalea sediminis]
MVNSMLLFSFVVPKKIKDDVTDVLIKSPFASGFNLTPILGYSQEHSSFNIEEQVRGYKHMCQFEVLIKQQNLQAIKDSLAMSFNMSGIRYWVTPILETGHI